jgi:transposase
VFIIKKKPAFKTYEQNQLRLLPANLEELIPQHHLVRVVNQAIDKMNTKPLFDKYEGGGSSSYHPVMMLKVVIYAYADKIYSCRKIAKACRENIMFMWLTSNQTPDFMTINRFRSERMKDVILDVFTEVVDLLMKEKYIKFENYFLDGTKIEANANKYSWVWGKSTKRYKEKLKEKCRELFVSIDIMNQEENAEYQDKDLEEMGQSQEINSESIKKAVIEIDRRLDKTPKNKELTKAKKTVEQDYLPRMEKYEEQEKILNERRSYSKTDYDATFMRMKEDHMKNGQLKPGYNVQMGTENQFIIGFSIHQRPGDTSCMKEHLDTVKEMLGKIPQNIVADAGYGSEENYEYLESNQLTGYVKYNTFHKESSKKWKNDITKVQNWQYDEQQDRYICGLGRPLVFMWEQNQKSENGYKSRVRIYECLNCAGCPYRDLCVKSKDRFANRRIYINPRLNELKEQARNNLCSEIGLKMRSLRPIEVESAFGDIKGNFGVRRFLLKGLEKVKLEWGLHSIAHNMRKMAAMMGQ